jgi:hypothetical protein
MVLYGEGLVFNFVRVVSSTDGPVSRLEGLVAGPDGNLVPVAGDAAH